MKLAIAAYNVGLTAYETTASLLYSVIRFRHQAQGAFEIKDEERCHVIVIAMNGPTLADDLDRAENSIGASTKIDFAVANHFADTDYFVDRQPRHYFFSDPYFWDNASDPLLIKKRVATFERISSQTSWPMRVYFPVHAKKDVFFEHFKHQKQISLHPFNAAALPAKYGAILGFAWDLGVCAPYGQNILIHAIYGAIKLGYSKIAIVGAGFSFHEQIHVDQCDNTFMKRRRHIYGESTDLAFVDQRNSQLATVATEFKALFNAFRTLEAVATYARLRGIEIVNYSEYSYLDMFDRPNANGSLKEPE